MCSNYCKDCVYKESINGKPCCMYICYKYEQRGCESGDGCTRKVSKNKKKMHIAFGKAVEE